MMSGDLVVVASELLLLFTAATIIPVAAAANTAKLIRAQKLCLFFNANLSV
jgi:hypothetical protein